MWGLSFPCSCRLSCNTSLCPKAPWPQLLFCRARCSAPSCFPWVAGSVAGEVLVAAVLPLEEGFLPQSCVSSPAARRPHRFLSLQRGPYPGGAALPMCACKGQAKTSGERGWGLATGSRAGLRSALHSLAIFRVAVSGQLSLCLWLQRWGTDTWLTYRLTLALFAADALPGCLLGPLLSGAARAPAPPRW